GSYLPYQKKESAGKDHYGPRPMEIDILAKDNSNEPRKQQSDENKLCFNCGKAGHFTRNCRQKQAKTNKPYKGKRHSKPTSRSVNVLKQWDEEVKTSQEAAPKPEEKPESEQDADGFTTEKEDNFRAYLALDG